MISLDATTSNGLCSNFESYGKSSRNDLKFKNFSVTPNLQGKVAYSPLDHLTGIQMIANVAESLEKREKVEADNSGAPGWIDENGKINIDKPLEIGDIVGTIKLPLIQSGMDGISCECSIVFNRYVSESQTIVEETNEVPGYEDLNLEDIINNSDEGEDFSEDFIDPNLPIGKRLKVDSVVKEKKISRKMEVYKYKEPDDSVNVQNELQNNIVPDLLKDPAVVRYLETMTGRIIQPMIKEEPTTEVEAIINETEEETGLEINMNEEENHEANYSVMDDCQDNSDILDKEEDCALKGVEEYQEVKKFSTIVVKWAQKVTDSESIKSESIDENSKDISAPPATENCSDKVNTDVVTELDEGSENDDSEQEMMDIESNIQEASSSDENIKDSISKKQLSLFGFKVEQFVEDITKEVKEKFCDKTYNGKENDVSQSDNTYTLTDKSLKFSCSVCQKSFHSYDLLAEHLFIHKKDNIKSSESVTVINNFVSKNISENKTESVCKSSRGQSNEKLLFYCMICNTLLPSQKDLQEHSKSHKKSGSNSENILKLDGTSASEDTLTAESDADNVTSNDNHIYSNSKESDIPSICVKPSRQRIIYEMKSKRSNRPKRPKMPKMPKKKTIRNDYICENCGTGFFDIHECISHMEHCKDSRTLKCFQGCGTRFKSKSLLDVHKKFCSRRLAYLERINNELVKIQNPGLNGDNNLEELHDKDEKLFKCPFCEEFYPTEKRRHHHQLVCRFRPKQKCCHCEFACKGDKTMAEHLVAEHGLKPYQCQHCQRTFRLKNSLNDHIRSIHTKETFTCEYCGKSFLKQSVYRSHVSIQHQGFRLECCYCGKKFKDKKTWKTHETSHKGVYDFACDVCKTTFLRSEQYRTHMLEVHSIDKEAALSLNSAVKKLREELCTNVCSICTEKFPLESAYVVHMMKVHGKEVPSPAQVINTETKPVTEMS